MEESDVLLRGWQAFLRAKKESNAGQLDSYLLTSAQLRHHLSQDPSSCPQPVMPFLWFGTHNTQVDSSATLPALDLEGRVEHHRTSRASI